MFVAQPPDVVAPVGGADVRDIVIALIITGVVSAPVAWFMLRERAGKSSVIGRFADWLAAKDGMPRWFSLPAYLTIVSILAAGFGVWWDVALHMQDGRDEGALSNPSHWPIFFGILGFFSAGVLSIILGHRSKLPGRNIRIAPGWRSPLGAFIMTGAGLIALVGFPADDIWHRIFGPDVTEWGPTHIMMIGGAVTCILGVVLLHAEAKQIGAPGANSGFGRLREAVLLSLCIVPFAFLMEFDLGVPQFPAATQFIIAAFLVGWVFTAVRMRFGPGGAVFAWAVYIVAHLFLMGTVALLPGVLIAGFLLFLPAALIIEAVALVVSPANKVRFGVIAGLLAGSLGMYAEWGWSHLFMPLPQPLPASALPLMLTVGTIAGVGGGLLAAWHTQKLDLVEARSSFTREDAARVIGLSPRTPAFWKAHVAGLTGILTFIGLMAIYAPPSDREGIEATASFTDVTYYNEQGEPLPVNPGDTECDGERRCEAIMTVRFSDPTDVDDAIWLYALGWQGRADRDQPNIPRDPEFGGAEGVVRVVMSPTGTPGEFVSERPLPLYGSWKTLIRVHLPPTVHVAFPVYAPDDPAILSDKGRQVTTAAGETKELITEQEFLQREVRDDAPAWLWTVAYIIVQIFWYGLIAFYGWCYATAAHGKNKRPSSTTAKPQAATT
ncbi:ABC transporter permease [Hoyosella sp. YIM 151337]|uniref:ABC transporter permease n=1 Tax=Hoyosella sp. YIM 151337 TaxID=2992742 RepID=UPI002235D757|nr:ABC transporter permease [Hoyosella sp. YIM 151337]MCW4354459.1 ABC transporter permease [Hoyosella sp. YIM 151337]